MLRLDADSTSRQGALEAVLDRFARAERAVLVGTQLVAKGHDFPDVRLAAAIDADVGLAMADFRAEERTFSLLVQLAGRAGREGRAGACCCSRGRRSRASSGSRRAMRSTSSWTARWRAG